MKAKRNILGVIALIGLSAALALCILSSASYAQSRDDKKDRTGGDRKREEPKREDNRDREPSRERTPDREPVRENRDEPARDGGDRTTREQPSRTDRDRSSADERDSGRDRNASDGSRPTDKRTVPSRGSSDGRTLPARPRPPREPGGKDYDRSRGDDNAGPVNSRPPLRPPRQNPFPDELVKKKSVPISDDRIRIIVEGWPYPPPWYPVFLHRYIVDPGYHYDPYLINLPFGAIEPREMEEGFLVLLNELWYDGMQDALLVCIVQTYRSMDVDRFELFFRRDDDVTIYGSFTPYSFLVLLPVRTVFELLEDPRIRWIGEYKPYYKINENVKLWDWDGALVFPLESDRGEFRDDLIEAGLAPDFYDEELGFYFVPAESYELEAIAEFWWVAEVLQVVSDPDLVYDYNYRTYE